MWEKDAGGEFIGGLAGLLARPFAGAAGSAAVRNKVVGGLTTHINDPLERLLHRVGAGKAVEGVARAAAVPVPKSWPLVGRLAEKSITIPEKVPVIGGLGSIPYLPTPEARATWAKTKSDNIINTVAQHPDSAAFSAATTLMAPVPGITEAYLGAKGLATKALNRVGGAASTQPVATPRSQQPITEEPVHLRWPPTAKEASAYLQGAKAAFEKFALNPNVLRPLIGAGLGAATGAALDKEHRGRGALLGAAGGAGAGYLASPAAMSRFHYGNARGTGVPVTPRVAPATPATPAAPAAPVPKKPWDEDRFGISLEDALSYQKKNMLNDNEIAAMREHVGFD